MAVLELIHKVVQRLTINKVQTLDDFEEALTNPDVFPDDLSLPATEDYAKAFRAIQDKLTDDKI